MYNTLTLAQLKEKLKERNVKSTGKKKDLVKRLEDLDQMGVLEKEPMLEWKMEKPEIDQYHDLNADSNVPLLTWSALEAYYKEQEKSFEKRYQDFYQERYLRFIRMAQSTDSVYFHCAVWSSMRKQTSYYVDIKLDSSRVITETQCECGVGQGPSAHCKHVACSLIAIVEFHKSGHVICDTTCTQELQTFHHVKSFRGSPVKAGSIHKNSYRFDPRPEEHRHADYYPSFFRSTVLNYAGPSTTMPVYQLYPPANLKALADDHCYTKHHPEQLFIKENMLHTDYMTAELQEKIEEETRGQSNNDRWTELRSVRITSSKFGEVLHTTDASRCARRLLYTKTFRGVATNYGLRYESVARTEYEKRTQTRVSECGLYISTNYPYLAASPDGLIGSDAVLEIKCPYTARDHEINPTTVPYLTDEGLKTNHSYYAQIQGQLYCTGRQVCHFVVYTQRDMAIFTIKRDELFINNMLLQLGDFYETHFKPVLFQKYLYKSYYDYY